MTSSYSPQLNGSDQQNQLRNSTPQRSTFNAPTDFVLGPNAVGSRPRNSDSVQGFTNGAGLNTQTRDAEHNLALLNHLSLDLGNLLNRTDISDCFLNVKGTRNLLL